MKSPYENIIKAIPEDELNIILKKLGYERSERKEDIRPKKMSGKELLLQNYMDKLKRSYFKSKKVTH